LPRIGARFATGPSAPDDAALRARLRELADQRRRFGYRRLHVLLRGEGWTMNRKKTQSR
jgi:putative transposase